MALLRGPLVYVELNPPSGPSTLAPSVDMRSAAGGEGFFTARFLGRERTYAPFYFVRDETYTTYFQTA